MHMNSIRHYREFFHTLNFDEFTAFMAFAHQLAPFEEAPGQLSAVEQRFCKPLVGGSSPSPGTNKINNLTHYGPLHHVAHVAYILV